MTISLFMRRLAMAGAALGVLGAYHLAVAQTGDSETMHGVIYPISFPTSSFQLHQADEETIHGVAAMMERDPNLQAIVIGKADQVGTPEYNEHLSWRRASAVFEGLVFKYGVSANRVEMRWTGYRVPLVAGSGPELQNRTVTIILH